MPTCETQKEEAGPVRMTKHLALTCTTPWKPDSDWTLICPMDFEAADFLVSNVVET